jgi:hypothetical protein
MPNPSFHRICAKKRANPVNSNRYTKELNISLERGVMPMWKRVVGMLLVVCGLVMAGCGSGGETVLAVPTGVHADSGPGFGQVTISWTAVAGATSYNIYWSTTPGATTASTKITGASNPYVQTNSARNFPDPFYYVVTAINAGAESGISTEVSATPSNVLN